MQLQVIIFLVNWLFGTAYTFPINFKRTLVNLTFNNKESMLKVGNTVDIQNLSQKTNFTVSPIFAVLLRIHINMWDLIK